MRTLPFLLVLCCACLCGGVSPLQAQAAPATDAAKSVHRDRMRALMEEFKSASTDAQRTAIHERMRQERAAYSAANPPKELSAAEQEARRLKMEEMLRKDPFRWEIYQLRRSMAAANSVTEKNNYQEKINTLMTRHAAEAEAKLTPEQRAKARERELKNAAMQQEILPLQEKLRAAKTQEERKALRAQIREVFKKYR